MSTTSSATVAAIDRGRAGARTLGFRDTAGLLGNLGVSLLLPVAATFVGAARPAAGRHHAGHRGRRRDRLGAARPRRRRRCPGGRADHGAAARAARPPAVVPADRAQPASSASAGRPSRSSSSRPPPPRCWTRPRWPFVLLAGVAATLMALRPLRRRPAARPVRGLGRADRRRLPVRRGAAGRPASR